MPFSVSLITRTDAAMKEQAFGVGECVTTPHGFVAEIANLTADCALIRYLGKHRHLGEMEMQLALLRPATAYDMVRAGIHHGDPSALKARTLPAVVIEGRHSNPQPHRNEHNECRSERNDSPPNKKPHGTTLQELIAILMKEHQERDTDVTHR